MISHLLTRWDRPTVTDNLEPITEEELRIDQRRVSTIRSRDLAFAMLNPKTGKSQDQEIMVKRTRPRGPKRTKRNKPPL